MKITFTATELEKPADMPLLADLAWRYFSINDGGWSAAECGCVGVVLTDESNDFDCSSYIFQTVNEFVKWLSDVAEEHLRGDPATFLIMTGMIDEAIASDEVVESILKTMKKEESV